MVDTPSLPPGPHYSEVQKKCWVYSLQKKTYMSSGGARVDEQVTVLVAMILLADGSKMNWFII